MKLSFIEEEHHKYDMLGKLRSKRGIVLCSESLPPHAQKPRLFFFLARAVGGRGGGTRALSIKIKKRQQQHQTETPTTNTS